jgi:hypothetical protein
MRLFQIILVNNSIPTWRLVVLEPLKRMATDEIGHIFASFRS